MLRFRKQMLWLGLVLIGVAMLLALALRITSSWEQSRTPGEKNLGVAALAIMFGVPSLFCAAAGVLSLLVSATAFAWSRLARSRATDGF
jgi:hypothetical protein